MRHTGITAGLALGILLTAALHSWADTVITSLWYGAGATVMAVDTVTNKIYAANGNVVEIDGATNLGIHDILFEHGCPRSP